MDTTKTIEGYSEQTAQEILADPSMHKLVQEILRLAETRDCVDAYYDTLTALRILRGRMDRALQGSL